MADRKAWREEKPRCRRHEDREREGSLLFSSPLKPITIQAPACFNSFEERKQRVGRLRPRKGCARLVGQESVRYGSTGSARLISTDNLPLSRKTSFGFVELLRSNRPVLDEIVAQR